MVFLKYFSKENIILFVLGFLVFNIFLPVNENKIPNLEYELENHDLKQENLLLIKKNNQFEYKKQKFKNEKSKIDSIITDYNVIQLDSFYTDYFK